MFYGFSSLHFPHLWTHHIFARTGNKKVYIDDDDTHTNLQTTLLLDNVPKDWLPSRTVFERCIWGLGLLWVVFLETDFWARFISFTLSRSSLPMVFDLENENLDLLSDNRWRPSLKYILVFQCARCAPSNLSNFVFHLLGPFFKGKISHLR